MTPAQMDSIMTAIQQLREAIRYNFGVLVIIIIAIAVLYTWVIIATRNYDLL